MVSLVILQTYGFRATGVLMEFGALLPVGEMFAQKGGCFGAYAGVPPVLLQVSQDLPRSTGYPHLKEPIFFGKIVYLIYRIKKERVP